LRFVSDKEAVGRADFVAGFAGLKFTIHFTAVFDDIPTSRGVWSDGTAHPGGLDVVAGDGGDAGLYADFTPGAKVGLRVGVSYTSIEQARRNLEASNGLTFEQVRSRAENLWQERLDSIVVEGGTDAQQRQFYTALYHTLLTPTDVTGDNGGWTDGEAYWDIHTLWDTFRTKDPLFILIEPERERGIIRMLLDVFKRNGWVPDSWVYNRSGIAFQGGTSFDNLVSDAVVKGLGGFDEHLAYEAIRKNATLPKPGGHPLFPDEGRLEPYFRLGYVPSVIYGAKDSEGCQPNSWSAASSRTLEYAYNDFCVSQVAEALGESADAARFRDRSLSAYKLFHPQKMLFWGKTESGEWIPDADPAEKTMGWRPIFYEGSAWQYRFSMPHDIAGLIARVGGNSAFLKLLDEYFDRGLHWQGNEPGFLTPWLHVFAGRPDLNVDRVRAIMAKDFRLAPAGYPGDEDTGAMSAWYLFAAMGFFPVAGQNVYLLASPFFSKVTIRLGTSGKTFVVSAPDVSPENKYVQSAALNGRPWDRAWFEHSDIADGGNLELLMGPEPSDWGTKVPPPSLTSSR
jgi:predicted alpha-1,2-mannosidase